MAFEMLLEEIEMVANGLNEGGAEAFRKGAYDRAREVIEVATRLAEFRDRVRTLQQEWSSLFAPRVATPRPTRRSRRRLPGRLQRGLRTPENAYRRPILETLIELGGKASMSDVLEQVETKMRDILNPYDYERLPSNPRDTRWRNSAQWCRNTLIKEGLMKSDSSYGIWEISDKGREAIHLGQV